MASEVGVVDPPAGMVSSVPLPPLSTLNASSGIESEHDVARNATTNSRAIGLHVEIRMMVPPQVR
jgi:hypothetical protein